MNSIFKTLLNITVLCSTLSIYGQDKSLFSLISPETTHIKFENTVVDSKEYNILIYSNFYEGAGVGVGDFNNDGLQDIFFTGNLVQDKLYLNKGNFEFKDITEIAGISSNSWSAGVALADVNNDGLLDIYISRELYDTKPEKRKNVLYMNNGISNNGIPTFTESAEKMGVNDQQRSRQAVFFDYDKDEDLDLFVLNHTPNAGNFSDLFGTKPEPKYSSRLYRNDGDTFRDVTEESGLLRAGYPNSISASDLNNDGWTDLYIANDFEVPDFLYMNNGDGTFTNKIESATKHISFYSMGVDAGDINNDGLLDVMVVDMAAEDNFRIKSNMSGMNPKTFWDLVDDGGHYQYMYNAMHLNNGMPTPESPVTFSDIAQLTGMSSTDWSWSNLIADLDNDGFKDVYLTNGLLKDIRNTDSDKAFSKHIDKIADEWIRKNPNAGAISIWDILDLEEALKIVPSQKISNYAFKNNGDLSFTKVAKEWGLDHKGFSHGAAYADLDNDGDLDLIVNNVNEVAHIYKNNSTSNNNNIRIQLIDSKKHRPIFGSRVQITSNDNTQLYEFTNVRGMYSTSENIAHFGLGKAEIVNELVITWPDGEKSVHKKLKANQLLTYDYAKRKISKIEIDTNEPLFQLDDEIVDHRHIENDFDDYSKQILMPHKMSQFGPALAVGDINGDGMDDLFSGGAAKQAPTLFIQNVNGEFSKVEDPVLTADAFYEDIDAEFIDIDGDNDLDLYVVSGGNEWAADSYQYADRLYINDGKGNFAKSNNLPAFYESGACVRPFDYDSDGDIDLFIGGRLTPWDYPAPATSRILQNEGGSFKDVTKSVAKKLQNIGLVTDAVWTDFDNDGTSDLVVVGEWMPITYFKYADGKFKDVTDKFGTPNSEGWWYSIEAVDMDNDGDEDLFAGNLGLNYKYKASKAEPFEVHYSDFDSDGSKDIVLSYYNFGKQFPLRGRSCSSQQIPSIGQKFKTYDLFANATLPEAYGPTSLQQALNYQAKSFTSIYLKNTGNGFQSIALPNEVQVSSINDFLIDDFDKDGIKDVLVAGNLYVSEIETPRNDAGVGLLLKADTNGSLQSVSPQNSGFFIPYDVKKIRQVSLGSDVYIVSAVNNGKLVLHKVVK